MTASAAMREIVGVLRGQRESRREDAARVGEKNDGDLALGHSQFVI